MRRKALLLDRDGVINIDHGFVGQVDRFTFQPDIFDLLKAANDRGYRLVVVTNQSGVARELYSVADFNAVNAAMLAGFAKRGITIDLVLSCFYHPQGLSDAFRRSSYWRKPEPGMVLEAATRLGLDLERSALIGDKSGDTLAGLRAGVGHCLLLDPTCQEVLPEGAIRIKKLSDALIYLR